MEQSTPRPTMPTWDESDDEDRPGPPPGLRETTHALYPCTATWKNPTCSLNGVNPWDNCIPISGTRLTTCTHG